MSNTALDLIWPVDTNILARIVFLYVGQGDSTIMLLADGDTYSTALVDINLDEKNGGINVPSLISDLLVDKENRLDYFINTHPHSDHLSGIIEIGKNIVISEIWHSGHKPGKNHIDAYDNLQQLIKDVKQAGGNERVLVGSKDMQTMGEVDYFIFAPASYVSDDIQDESPEARYKRIHEQCVVMKFGKSSKWVMLTGDADQTAWEEHITDYHKANLDSIVLSAPHHGSKSFFYKEGEAEPYLDALISISPNFVVISAPTSKESPHGHPDKEALELYVDQIGDKDNLLHTGDKRYSFIVDIYRDDKLSIQKDNGKLAEAYSLSEEAKKRRSSVVIPPVVPPVDSRKMGY